MTGLRNAVSACERPAFTILLPQSLISGLNGFL